MPATIYHITYITRDMSPAFLPFNYKRLLSGAVWNKIFEGVEGDREAYAHVKALHDEKTTTPFTFSNIISSKHEVAVHNGTPAGLVLHPPLHVFFGTTDPVIEEAFLKNAEKPFVIGRIKPVTLEPLEVRKVKINLKDKEVMKTYSEISIYYHTGISRVAVPPDNPYFYILLFKNIAKKYKMATGEEVDPSWLVDVIKFNVRKYKSKLYHVKRPIRAYSALASVEFKTEKAKEVFETAMMAGLGYYTTNGFGTVLPRRVALKEIEG